MTKTIPRDSDVFELSELWQRKRVGSEERILSDLILDFSQLTNGLAIGKMLWKKLLSPAPASIIKAIRFFEVGNALADVLFGNINPSGRLPLTLPVRVQDIPSYPNFRSDNAQIHYREDLFVGYRGYAVRGVKPLFPFGCAFLPSVSRRCVDAV